LLHALIVSRICIAEISWLLKFTAPSHIAPGGAFRGGGYAISNRRTAVSCQASVLNSTAAASIAASGFAASTLPIHLALPAV
jgi:hypothetical protein